MAGRRDTSKCIKGRRSKNLFLPKAKIEVVVSDDVAEKVITTIQEQAKTGNICDGKIFVTKLVNVVRVGTGERGEIAI